MQRASSNSHLGQGYLHLSGLQLRGHAMFSAEDRPIEVETLEYAWLLELQIGTFSGKVTLPQVFVIFDNISSNFVLAKQFCTYVTSR